MGTFAGHAIPGSFFVLFALWWTGNIFSRYYTSLLSNGRKYASSATYPVTCLPGNAKTWEMEGLLKILFCAVGITGEMLTAFDEDGRFAYMGNGQHATMFAFFAFSGIVDILVNLNFPLPKGTEWVVGITAFIVEGILFKFHVEGRDGLDVLLHTLLLYAIGAGVLVMIVELRFRENALVSLCRTFFVFVQGTWFWQVGWILYPPLGGHSGNAKGGTGVSAISSASALTEKNASDLTLNSVSNSPLGGPSGGAATNGAESDLTTNLTKSAIYAGGGLSNWLVDDHDEKLLATMIFTWHMAAVLLIMLSIGGFIGWFYRRKHGPFDLFSNPYDALEMHLIQKNSNGHTVINMHDESESDLEFEQPMLKQNGTS